jgi:hypothetical protein
MGTRGLWGFVIDGETKVTYNHFDSYPGGLGTDLVKALGNWDPQNLLASARALKMVNADDKPTTEQQQTLAGYADLTVSTQSLDEWYVLLRDTQGDMQATLDAGFMIDSFAFGFDSLFCEWGYVINLDGDGATFEIYKGFQKSTTDTGLWRDGGMDHDYGPIALIERLSLDTLTEDWGRGDGGLWGTFGTIARW